MADDPDVALVEDAHAFAKQLAKKLSDEKHDKLDGADGAPWVITCLTELARLMAVSYVAATDTPTIFQLFMRHIAEGPISCTLPVVAAESIRQARSAAASIDEAPERMQ